MLTIKENLLETMKKDGTPDRFVNQYEFMDCIFEASYYMGDYPFIPGNEGYDQYGVFWRLPVGQMGAFPVHDEEHRLVKDITKWKEVVKRPFLIPAPPYWDMLKGKAAATDRNQKFVASLHPQGLFERIHALMGMEDAMANFYEEPECMHELIDFITDVEIEYAHAMIEKVGIDCVLHHDDWGSYKNSFMSPAMFDEFILPAYKKIYGVYKENNVLIVHHNDGFSANLVPEMIEMGIDIWQGPVPTNNIPELIDKYEGQITFMGEIESKLCDIPNWDPEVIANEVRRACTKVGPRRSFIPSSTLGTPGSFYPGAYEEISKNIDLMSKELF